MCRSSAKQPHTHLPTSLCQIVTSLCRYLGASSVAPLKVSRESGSRHPPRVVPPFYAEKQAMSAAAGIRAAGTVRSRSTHLTHGVLDDVSKLLHVKRDTLQNREELRLCGWISVGRGRALGRGHALLGVGRAVGRGASIRLACWHEVRLLEQVPVVHFRARVRGIHELVALRDVFLRTGVSDESAVRHSGRSSASERDRSSSGGVSVVAIFGRRFAKRGVRAAGPAVRKLD